MIFLFAACAGCAGLSGETGDLDSPGTTTGDVVVEATAKESVFRISWNTQFEGTTTVECGVDDAFDHLISGQSADGLSHVVLAALGEATTWTCRATSIGSGSKSWTSESFDIEIPAAPPELPGLTVSGDTSRDGLVLFNHTAEGLVSCGVSDREGRHRWWEIGETGDIISQTWLSQDGEHVMYITMNDQGVVHKVSIDGETHERWEIEDAHHDFLPLPDGTVAVLRYDIRAYDDVQVYGDDLAIYDADGNLQRVVWSAFDSFEPDPDTFPDSDYYDWTHANSIWYDADEGLFLVSLWTYDLILGIDADDGSIRWRIGLGAPDFRFEGEGETFSDQHSPRLTDAGLLMFNNRNIEQATDDLYSEVVEFAVDWEAGTYQRAWSYDADQSLPVFVMGNADEVGDGHVFAGWGSGGRMTELDADHEVIWQADADLGGAMGFVHLIDEFSGATR